MAVSVESFLTSFPEFEPAGEGLIAAKIAAGALQVDAGLWGEKADLGVELTAAHLLALSPFGQQARLIAKDGTTTYGNRLHVMQRQVASGYRLI